MAECYGCVVGFKCLPYPIGNQHEPFGTCRNCHSHACGHHAQRDGNVPEFRCFKCDPQLLGASAVVGVATRVPAGSSAQRVARTVLSGYHADLLANPSWAFQHIDDFLTRCRGYGNSLPGPYRRVDYSASWNDNDLRDFLRPLTGSSQDLLVLAGAIVNIYILPFLPGWASPSFVAPYLLDIAHHLVP